ncbi:hypothetical protein [Tunicatimonas pelagia]|nr:hypothetical protein [Tunicatimonas pelagia]WKN42343.1 hypothetical protein P0M28_25235 [Tunicatimonas pelagia]
MEEKLAYKHHLTVKKAEDSSEKLGEMLTRKWGTTNLNAFFTYYNIIPTD